MGLSHRIQDVVKGTADLLLTSNDIFNKAVAKINKPNPNYTADDLTKDVTQIGLKTLLLWLKFWTPLAGPVLPTVTISTPRNNIRGNANLQGTVSLADSVPLGVSPTVTPLVFMGWAAVPAPTDASQVAPLNAKTPIPDADMDPLRQDLAVFLNVPNSAPVPEQGVYQGFVLLGQTPLAIVVVRAL